MGAICFGTRDCRRRYSQEDCGAAPSHSRSVPTLKKPHRFQCAMSTRVGIECIVHVLQALTELDPFDLFLVEPCWKWKVFYSKRTFGRAKQKARCVYAASFWQWYDVHFFGINFGECEMRQGERRRLWSVGEILIGKWRVARVRTTWDPDLGQFVGVLSATNREALADSDVPDVQSACMVSSICETWCVLNWPRVSPKVATKGCGNVWWEFSTPVPTKGVAMADWVCETAPAFCELGIHWAWWSSPCTPQFDRCPEFRASIMGKQGFLSTSWEMVSQVALFDTVGTIFKECVEKLAGGSTNVMMRDLDFPVPHVRDPQIEIVVDACFCSGSRLHCDSECEPVSCARLVVDNQWRVGHSWVVKRFLWCWGMFLPVFVPIANLWWSGWCSMSRCMRDRVLALCAV